MSDYTLVLVPLYSDGYDVSGVLINKTGPIEHPNFEQNDEVLKGFSGIKWGYSKKEVQKGYSKKFAVVKVYNNIINLDTQMNYVKFSDGYVVKCGSFKKCIQCIKDNEGLPKDLQNLDLFFIECQSEL